MAVRPILRISGVIAALAAVVLAGAVAYFLTFSPDRKRFPLRGIDVSHHQGVVDWQRVRGDDDAFAYVKATGREVIFYVIDDFLAAYGESLPPRGLWRRSILREPGPSPWTFWQYHNRGWIAGIDKFVDLNVFYADGPSLTAWSARQDPALIR